MPTVQVSCQRLAWPSSPQPRTPRIADEQGRSLLSTLAEGREAASTKAVATAQKPALLLQALTLGAVRAGDIIEVDRKGRRFFAIVVERRERELGVEPIDRRVTYRRVKAREVIGIWHKTRSRNGRDSQRPLGQTARGIEQATGRRAV